MILECKIPTEFYYNSAKNRCKKKSKAALYMLEDTGKTMKKEQEREQPC